MIKRGMPIYCKDFLTVYEESLAGLSFGFIIIHEDLDDCCNIVGCCDTLDEAKSCVDEYVKKDRIKPIW